MIKHEINKYHISKLKSIFILKLPQTHRSLEERRARETMWPLSRLGSRTCETGWPREAWRGRGRVQALAFPTDHIPSWNCLGQWCFQRPFCVIGTGPCRQHLVMCCSLLSPYMTWVSVSVYCPLKVTPALPSSQVFIRLRVAGTMSVQSDTEAVNSHMRQCKLRNHISRSLESDRLSRICIHTTEHHLGPATHTQGAHLEDLRRKWVQRMRSWVLSFSSPFTHFDKLGLCTHFYLVA